MARKELIRTHQYPYHVYARTNKREWFEGSLDDIWDIYCNLLYILSFIYECKIHAFVLMNNHFHLLLTTPQENLDKAMLYFMRESSREVNLLAGGFSRVYSGRYKWSLVNNEKYYYLIMKYIYNNPVEVGIVKKVEDYKYSTIRMKLGLDNMSFLLSPFYDDVLEISHPYHLMHFCNEGQSLEASEVIEKSLQKPVFKIPSRAKKSIIKEMENAAQVRRK